MIVAVGISYREVPIEVRERLALDAEAVVALARSLVEMDPVSEAICLSTCNRVEIYACATDTSTRSIDATADAVASALEGIAVRNGLPGIRPHLKTRHGTEAVRHLCRVASSLDSLILGEPQILGQVKQALDLAREAGAVGRYLERAVSRALHVAKRVRTETAVGEGQVSVSSVAVDLARQIFGDLRGRPALLVGAGEMAETAAKLLRKAGATLLVVNRSAERAQSLAESLGATTRPWSELVPAIAGADVVIASTAARTFVITQSMVAQAMRARRGRSLFFVDIAVPRDVDPTINDLDNVYVYDIDNLSQTVTESMTGRQIEAQRAEMLVEHEAKAFESWMHSQRLNGTIVALRTRVRSAIACEVEKTLSGRLRHLSLEERAALETMVEAATNRVLHTPLTRLKALAADPGSATLMNALHALFELPECGETTTGTSTLPATATATATATLAATATATLAATATATLAATATATLAATATETTRIPADAAEGIRAFGSDVPEPAGTRAAHERLPR